MMERRGQKGYIHEDVICEPSRTPIRLEESPSYQLGPHQARKTPITQKMSSTARVAVPKGLHLPTD